ncbi:hypothetical protein Pmani_019204 [Petrolisthes manimaculis]|uniref:Uncharacterized protein n=1 Tax=Petrolisthes manimaculis TaxID=1843537 RepID=A0AAE1PK23_9EUCA|nr:hypothetical protein Pmani_019204 [Petrolisthes manimaculis]
MWKLAQGHWILDTSSNQLAKRAPQGECMEAPRGAHTHRPGEKGTKMINILWAEEILRVNGYQDSSNGGTHHILKKKKNHVQMG